MPSRFYGLIILLLLFFIGFTVLHFLWLFGVIVSLTGLYRLSSLIKNAFLRFSYKVLMTLLISVTLKVFVFEIFLIPSSSMENALFSGDMIIVNKLSYGPKNPFLWFADSGYASHQTQNFFLSDRLSGLSGIERNDIFVFLKKTPVEKYLVKRCIGLPGERLQIINGKVLVNQHTLIEPQEVKKRYTVYYKQKLESSDVNFIQGLRAETQDLRRIGKSETLLLTNKQHVQLQNTKSIDSVIFKSDTAKSFPWGKLTNWTVDNFGTITIPNAGMKILLTKTSYGIYSKIINQDEGVKITERNGRYWEGNKRVSDYTFKYNYLFVLGDNRAISNDSRYWGFVCETNIIGKASKCPFFYN